LGYFSQKIGCQKGNRQKLALNGRSLLAWLGSDNIAVNPYYDLQPQAAYDILNVLFIPHHHIISVMSMENIRLYKFVSEVVAKINTL